MGLEPATATLDEMKLVHARSPAACPRCGAAMQWGDGTWCEDSYVQAFYCDNEDCDFLIHEVSEPSYWEGAAGESTLPLRD